MFFSPDDVGNLHERIVNGDTEVVNWYPIRPKNNEVADCCLGIPTHSAPYNVIDLHPRLGGDPEPERVGIPRRHLGSHHLRVCVTPRVVVFHRKTLFVRLRTLGFELLLSAKAWVGDFLIDEPLGHLLVEITPFRLAVRAVIAPDVRTFVPIQTQPTDVLQHALLRFPGGSSQVRIFDADDKFPPCAAGLQPVEEGCPGTSDVEGSSGRWSETHAHTSF
mmetsp:Transcript_12152/g.16050  ORF Transcript_12152/g.16050 Transcript_12152/m.16050 type:complete len:219 (+) Transcript_12152:1312-1968(+)